MDHNARVLCLSSDDEISEQMRMVDSEEEGIRHMTPKGRHYLLKLQHVRRPIAHILKEAFLSQGGDAAVSRDLITAQVDYSDVILCGTRKQFSGVFANLREQGFGSEKLADEIQLAINRFDAVPEAPSSSELINPALEPVFQAIGRRTLVMGILNVTPDSFSDGGKFLDSSQAVTHGIRMAQDGADIIDIGGESTRPGSAPVPAEDEIRRVVPVIEQLAKAVRVPISIDTTKAEVARAALDAGASIVNDISGASFDPDMPPLLAQHRCPVAIMHIKGTPQDMQSQATYQDLMGEISRYLRERMRALVDAGVDERLIAIDPGVGFGKTVEHNLEILRRLREFKSIGRPILVGTSRKSTIGKVLDNIPAGERLEGTAATVAISIANGADIVRVHDVREMGQVARMADAIVRYRER